MTRAPLSKPRLALLISIAPAIALISSLIWTLAIKDQLPTRVANHFDVKGYADAYGSFLSGPILLLALGTLLFLGMLALCLSIPTAISNRIIVAATIWTALVFAGLNVSTLYPQIGASENDVIRAHPLMLPLVLLGGAAIAAIIAWKLPLPPVPTQPSSQGTAMEIPSSNVTAWYGTAHFSPALTASVLVLALVLAIAAGLVWLHADQTSASIITAIALVGILLGISVIWWKVRINNHGFTVSSIFGLPRHEIALGDIAKAEVVYTPLAAEFGGWGWRFNPGGIGVITSNKPVLKITRKNGKFLAVTCDNPEQAAGVVNALIGAEILR